VESQKRRQSPKRSCLPTAAALRSARIRGSRHVPAYRRAILRRVGSLSLADRRSKE
jgi:hypothetical protein